MTARLCVVTPTHRRPDLLERLLSSLEAQTVSPDDFEIAVVDDASGDETPHVLGSASERMPNLRWESFERGRGPAAARNRGASLSRAPIILFLDDDVEAIPPLIEIHLRLHDEARDPTLGILGRVEWDPKLEITDFMRWVDASGLQFAYDTWLRPGEVDPPFAAFYTANLSVHREIFERVGTFNESFPYPAYEDMELAWRLARAGFHMRYHPQALVYHTRAIDLPTYRRRMSKVAESAEILKAVQPDFPLDEDYTPASWPAPPSALRRWVDGVVSSVTGSEVRRRRYYRNEIAASYREGSRRGRERLEGRSHD